MRQRVFAVSIAAVALLAAAQGQQSHWASADDKAAQYIVDMERKWAEGVCLDNGVVANLLAEDFQGTSTDGKRFTKADELKDEKGTRIARDCGLDEAKVHFLGDSIAVVYGREHAVGKDKAQPNAKGMPDLDRYVAGAGRQMANCRIARQSRGMQVNPDLRSHCGQEARDSMARTSSGASTRLRLARSCRICSALEVPVKGNIPTARAKLNTT
jgi:hypothetical protein